LLWPVSIPARASPPTATIPANCAGDQTARAPKAVSEAFAALYSDDDDEGSYDDGTYERVTKAPGYGDEGCF